MKFRVSPFSFDFSFFPLFFTQSAQRERSVATTITTPNTVFTLTKRTRFEPHLSDTHMQQRKENTAVSARPAEMCLCKDAAKRKGGTPLRFMQEHSHRHAVLRIRQARDCFFFFFFLQPLKLISGKKYWRSHLDRHAGCDVRCTGLAQALGIGMRTGMTLERRSLRCRYIFSQVSCFFVFFTVWHVVCPQGVRGKPWDSRCARLQHLVSARVKRGHGSLCLQTSVQWTG